MTTFENIYIIYAFRFLKKGEKNKTMINVTELRPGNYFLEDGNIYQVLDILLNKTAMAKMKATVKVKNMRTGAVTEVSRNGGYSIDLIRLDKIEMQYLYDSGDGLVFMNQTTYEQIEIPKERLEWEKQFLKGDEIVTITSYENEILGIVLPAKVTLKVTDAEPAVKGNTVQRAMREVTLETGLKVKVPLFINQGDEVIVRTDNGQYDGRAN